MTNTTDIQIRHHGRKFTAVSGGGQKILVIHRQNVGWVAVTEAEFKRVRPSEQVPLFIGPYNMLVDLAKEYIATQA